jgi:hypothetical protein
MGKKKVYMYEFCSIWRVPAYEEAQMLLSMSGRCINMFHERQERE